MAANGMKNALDRKMRITKTALNRVRSGTGQDSYRPLETYMKLKPDDFVQIVEEYGLDETVRYIKAMEGMRMRGTNGRNN